MDKYFKCFIAVHCSCIMFFFYACGFCIIVQGPRVNRRGSLSFNCRVGNSLDQIYIHVTIDFGPETFRERHRRLKIDLLLT